MPVPSNITGCSTDTAANIITIGADGVPTTNDHLARGYANDRTIAQIAQQAATQNPDVTFTEPPTTGKYLNSKLAELISNIFTFKNWNGTAYDTWLTISQFWQGVLSSANSNDAQAALGIQIPYRNYIDNPIGPAGIVYQRTVAATADDVYFADRWYVLMQNALVTPSIITAPETGFASGLRVTQSTATAQRYGFAQILPADYVNELVSGNVSCSFRARISNTTTLRFALLGWTGTADAVISDVVNDWTSTNYTTGNFFISTSLSVIATGSQAMTANTFGTLSINAAAIPANAKNLILFCWTETTQAQNTALDFHDARLTKTDVRVPVVARPLGDESISCRRRFKIINVKGATGVTFQTNGDTRCLIMFDEMVSLPTANVLSGQFNVIAYGDAGTVLNIVAPIGSLIATTNYSLRISVLTNMAAFAGIGGVFSWGDGGSADVLISLSCDL